MPEHPLTLPHMKRPGISAWTVSSLQSHMLIGTATARVSSVVMVLDPCRRLSRVPCALTAVYRASL